MYRTACVMALVALCAGLPQSFSWAEEIKLEKPQNVTVEVIRSSGTWEVHVGWGLPRLLPDSYSVTLYLGGPNFTLVHYKIESPGNASEVVFKDVKGEGNTMVFVNARLGNKWESSTAELLVEPQNVTVEAIRDSVNTCEVHVGWKLPRFLPDSYTVILRTNTYGNHTIVIPGNASEVVFKAVKDEDDSMKVFVEARFGDITSSSVKLAHFPEAREPDIPQHVTVIANKDFSLDTWKVHVGWELPYFLPDSYSVTLLTDGYGNHTIVIPGNATEAEFKDVKGEGTYVVMITARLDFQTATSSKQASFPVFDHFMPARKMYNVWTRH